MSAELLNRFNVSSNRPPVYGSVNEWVSRGMQTAGESMALYFSGVAYSHSELDRWSNQIANDFIRRGIERGSRVGLCLDRSAEQIAVLLGVLKAGAVYVPLDPAYPARRLAMMQSDADLNFLVVHARHAGQFREFGKTLLEWENIKDGIDGAPSDPIDVAVDSKDTAYIIFTSGSTGRPKGIAMPHRALSNLIEWQLERRFFKHGARVLQFSSISFDVSFQEIATTLASGGALYLIAEEDRKDSRKLLAILVEQKIDRLFLPYVALRSLVETANVLDIYPEHLKEIITAGEQLRIDAAVRQFFQRIAGATLDNQYGPSETHVISAQLLEGNPLKWPDLPAIGTPLKNCGSCILDAGMRPVAEGEVGELYLSGRNLALGYIGGQDLTDEVFIPNPFDAPERPVLYKTGDLAAYNSDGSINFLGRVDDQIKIRGHRIEPGEINNAASAFPRMGTCLTHAFSGEGGMLQLATYYTVIDGESVDVSLLRKHLEDQLPEYMVPAFLIEIAQIPRTPSGKVDLKALPRPTIANTQYAGDSVRYATPTEKRLASIWSQLLGLDNIPSHADFFELGGDSLRAVNLFLNIQKEFGKELSLAVLIQASTIKELSALIDSRDSSVDLSEFRSLEMIQQGNKEIPPLFMVHGGQGNVLVFNKFSHNLGPDQPIYAFKWSGWDGRRGDGSVAKMARAYCDELLRFNPAGPIRLGGYCIGGLIAIDLVRLLRQNGIQVLEPLIVCDTPNLASKHYRRDEPWDSAEAIDAFKQMIDELNALHDASILGNEASKPDYLPPSRRTAMVRSIPGLMALLRKTKQFIEWVKSVPQMNIIHRALASKKPVPMDMRAAYCQRVLVKAAKAHRTAVYDGDVLYFRSNCVLGRYFALSGWWNDPYLGFEEICSGKFEAHAVGGNHTDVLDRPELADIVRRAIGRA